MREKIGKYGIALGFLVLFVLCFQGMLKARGQELTSAEMIRQERERAIVSSRTGPESCYLCGRNAMSLMGYYRKRNSVGVLLLNDWNITDAQAIALNDEGEEIACDGKSSTVYDSFGEGNGSVVVSSRKERGISRMEVYLEAENWLDLDLAADKLCQHCLNGVTDCFPGLSVAEMEEQRDAFVLDFLSGQLYCLKAGAVYETGDYYVETSERNDGIFLLVVYAPEREIEEFSHKDFKRRK